MGYVINNYSNTGREGVILREKNLGTLVIHIDEEYKG